MCRVIPQRYRSCSCPTFRTGLCSSATPAAANTRTTESASRRHAEKSLAFTCRFFSPHTSVVEVPGLCQRHLQEAINARWTIFSHFVTDFHRAYAEGKADEMRTIYHEQVRTWESLYRQIVDYETNLWSNPDPEAADFRRWLGVMIKQFNEKIEWMREFWRI